MTDTCGTLGVFLLDTDIRNTKIDRVTFTVAAPCSIDLLNFGLPYIISWVVEMNGRECCQSDGIQVKEYECRSHMNVVYIMDIRKNSSKSESLRIRGKLQPVM